MILTKHFSIQRINDISAHNADLAQKLVMENRELTRDKYEALDKQKIKHTEALSTLHYQHSNKVSLLNAEMKKKDEIIVDLQEMANEVAQEFHDLKNVSSTDVQKHRALADSRHAKMKAEAERNESLRDRLEHDQDYYENIITDAYNQIDDLQSRLRESTTMCNTLTLACDIARQDIAVSMNTISFCSTATNSFISTFDDRI